MLALFHQTIAHPPKELNCPEVPTGIPPKSGQRRRKNRNEILDDFRSIHGDDCFVAAFAGNTCLVYPASPTNHISFHQRQFCCFDNIYCMFLGSLNNLSSLIKQYGLCSKSTNESLLLIEAYRTLRDRAPYPADQVIKDLSGSFGFVVYDNTNNTVFAAMSSDGGIPLYWGVGGDGLVVICDNVGIVKESCGKSYAPFPAGCMFHSEGGLKSFEHPMNKMKAMPRVDSEGVMCGASFKVDTCAKINSMPRVGSAANWDSWDHHSH